MIPAGADKGVFLLAPLATATFSLAAWAVIPVNEDSFGKWVVSGPQCGCPLSARHLVARRLRRHHGRLGIELEIPVHGQPALGGADDLATRSRSVSSSSRCCCSVGSLNLTTIVNAQEVWSRDVARHARVVPRLALGAAVPDVRRVLHLVARRDQSPAVRSRRSGITSWSRASWWNTGRRPISCSCSASTSPSPPCARWQPSCSLGGWLPPVDVWPLNAISGHFLVCG